MSYIDQINSFFPFVGCFFILANIMKLREDQRVTGLQWYSPLFFYVGQCWNIYFMFTMGKWWSFFGGAALTLTSFVWYGMMIYYNYIKKA